MPNGLKAGKKKKSLGPKERRINPIPKYKGEKLTHITYGLVVPCFVGRRGASVTGDGGERARRRTVVKLWGVVKNWN